MFFLLYITRAIESAMGPGRHFSPRIGTTSNPGPTTRVIPRNTLIRRLLVLLSTRRYGDHFVAGLEAVLPGFGDTAYAAYPLKPTTGFAIQFAIHRSVMGNSMCELPRTGTCVTTSTRSGCTNGLTIASPQHRSRHFCSARAINWPQWPVVHGFARTPVIGTGVR